MASPRESEILTHVGPGTPMGELMRQYWIPAALSSELEADGDPMRLMLLGEKLIAFRDSKGKVGVMDHRCPHRCTSLFFGRNEAAGIRCVYHGWKFDADGNCIDMPNVPPHQDYKQKVHAKAYKTIEQNGLIWVYMGPREKAPDLPAVEPMFLPDAERRVFFAQRECNYLQALEGDIDTSHFGFLHAGAAKEEDFPLTHSGRFALRNRSPELEVSATPWGTMYGAHRPADPGQTYWRFAHFLFPFWTMPPDGDFMGHLVARAWVPMDDTHTMFVHMSWSLGPPPLRVMKDGTTMPGGAFGLNYLPNTTDWYGRWRLAANASNDYQIDRNEQRTASFTGIQGIHMQDQAVTESMGGITDHSFERLGPSDLMIIQTRRRLAAAAQAFREGKLPPGVDNPRDYLMARGGDFVADSKLGFLDAYAYEMDLSNDPTGRLERKLRLEERAAAQAGK